MGVNVYEYLIFDGVSTEDFGVHISGSGTYDSPKRDIESCSIPGRDGDLHIDHGRFENISIEYPAFCVDNFTENFDAFKAFMHSRAGGYKRLEDSYHHGYYRRAAYNDSLTPNMTPRNKAGDFTIVFDCDPRRFLTDGEEPIEVTTGSQLKNPTYFNSRPLIRAYGTGSFTIEGVTVTITSANVYTDIDCELEDAYKGSTNCNGNITLINGEFPRLKPGLNTITFTGLTRLIITPNWWTV